MSNLPLLALKSHWLSGKSSLAMVGTSQLSRNLVSTLPAIKKMVNSPAIGAVRLSTLVLVHDYDDDVAKVL